MKDVLGIVPCISYILLASPGFTHKAAYSRQVTWRLDSAEEVVIWVFLFMWSFLLKKSLCGNDSVPSK